MYFGVECHAFEIKEDFMMVLPLVLVFVRVLVVIGQWPWSWQKGWQC